MKGGEAQETLRQPTDKMKGKLGFKEVTRQDAWDREGRQADDTSEFLRPSKSRLILEPPGLTRRRSIWCNALKNNVQLMDGEPKHQVLTSTGRPTAPGSRKERHRRAQFPRWLSTKLTKHPPAPRSSPL